MTRDNRLIVLELNEITFPFLESYFERGELPHLQRFIARNGYRETTSETRYEHLEPWIQWVTAHTGLPLAEHGVFRLGDIVNHDIPQIWERLEEKGIKVGAISPMNAKFRLKDPAFFVPDPWTPTRLAAPPLFQRMYQAIAQAVNDNAHQKITAQSAFHLMRGAFKVAPLAHYPLYLSYVRAARQKPWVRALFLDLLLADLFIHCLGKSQARFATLFLNAGAHIQHHYMFSSPVYRGGLRNPSWYIPADQDPLLDVYRLYDHILGIVEKRFPEARLMLVTGLHQDPHTELTYYWRLKDHDTFLRMIGVPATRVETRMSRDFIAHYENAAAAAQAQARLEAARARDGLPLFEVDNRGDNLFVMLTYPRDIDADFTYQINGENFTGLRDAVAFVAIKNGRHNGTGYYADSQDRVTPGAPPIPLTRMPEIMADAFA